MDERCAEEIGIRIAWKVQSNRFAGSVALPVSIDCRSSTRFQPTLEIRIISDATRERSHHPKLRQTFLYQSVELVFLYVTLDQCISSSSFVAARVDPSNSINELKRCQPTGIWLPERGTRTREREVEEVQWRSATRKRNRGDNVWTWRKTRDVWERSRFSSGQRPTSLDWI